MGGGHFNLFDAYIFLTKNVKKRQKTAFFGPKTHFLSQKLRFYVRIEKIEVITLRCAKLATIPGAVFLMLLLVQVHQVVLYVRVLTFCFSLGKERRVADTKTGRQVGKRNLIIQESDLVFYSLLVDQIKEVRF